jgi:cell division protein FtsW
VGLGNSVQKTLYLPYPQNDFILAIIGEELGFVGVFLLICVYLWLIWRGCHVAMNAVDYTGMMLAAGITMMIGIQVIINIAVVTSCMPPTGIILPFISYGGNALLIFMGAMGILLNISKHQTNQLQLTKN